ncbi:hypothetical protein JOB18_027682 [Solea senegalensis]|uniref:Uncharacterized protein n=1 Tax=Solea senegalensis TaxID=28829 RepID=A0AAV6Q3D2_SOLSE|nr:uncharacterized protein LOC122772566 [Solea senegalensis]KAG7482669.1 hypothetical protein JOB18_027682 [Solea senegalensis]
MASTTVLLLQLLLVSLAAASHHYGGSETYTYKGRNPDGSFRVDIRSRSTFRGGCGRYYYPYCRGSSCATITATGTIDRSSQWCETETLSTMNVTSDRPLSRSTHGCCWVQTRNSVFSWNLMTYMNLGTRSDTRQPNRSPDTAILPHLRVPHNCPRTYNIMAFDPDGDRVRCQYSRNNQPQGFHLDQNSCKLYYNSTTPSSTAFGFELELEDHPQRHITLIYTGGHTITVPPLSLRRRKRAATNTTYATTTAATTTTTAVTTTTAATTTPATTTTAATC